MIPLSESHLRFTLKSWIAHYDGGRPHMSLGPGIPSSPGITSVRPEPSSRNRRGESYAVRGESILCAIRSAGRTLDFSLREARKTDARLYLLFVREQPFMTEQDVRRKWQEDPEASAIFAEAKQKAGDQQPLFAYAVSPSAADTIVDVAATLGASRVILGAPQRSSLINLLRGNVIREVSNSLPDDIDLLVYA